MKLNTKLAKTEHSGSQFKALITAYNAFFKGKQSEFKGVKKTYQPKDGTADEPSMRGNTNVVTTVNEKLKWLVDTSSEHIDNVFSVEATNASNTAKAPLVVDGVNFGDLSSLELLRLKSFLEAGELEQMYANIPVRSDSENWDATAELQYKDRSIFETPELKGTKKTIQKEAYILPDPNVDKLRDSSKYVPQVASKDTVLDLGDYTVQHFSGESTHRERAEILARRSKLISAVIEALKVANDVETVQSSLTAKKLFDFIHGSK